MEIKLYNSLTNKIETFHEIRKNEVSIYVCGPTVYNYVHIGNMRPVVVFDILRRLFIYLGYKVTFISNFTDIDDKIIKQAKIEHLSEKEIAEKYINAFEEARIGVHSLKPDYQPQVTQTIDKIIAFVSALVDKDYAYVTKNNDVYFRVSKIKDYGCLSNMKIDDLLVGARIDENEEKESPLDFALWKNTYDDGIKFPSPWGEGRPGWHTECVVMINSLIEGGKIDIHGGGFDLKFPHHENEIAQEEAYYGHKIANYWMHNGFINVDNVKMSKSLGNVILANDYIKLYGGNTVRYLLLNTHYRQPVNFSTSLVEAAQKELTKMESCLNKLSIELQRNYHLDETYLSADHKDMQNFLLALCDDLNTANAMSELYKVMKEINVLLRNKEKEYSTLLSKYQIFKTMLNLLGLEFKQVILTEEDKKLLTKYDEAKANHDFITSDKLREELISKKLI